MQNSKKNNHTNLIWRSGGETQRASGRNTHGGHSLLFSLQPRAPKPFRAPPVQSILPPSNARSLIFSSVSRAVPSSQLTLEGRRRIGVAGVPKPVPAVRAQNSTDYIPEANFYKIEAILRPWSVSHVSSALLQMGIRGVTVLDVRGFGAHGNLSERHEGSEFSEDKLIAKVKMEIVVSKEKVEAVINKIIEEARTGEIGDGKIFMLPVSDVIRVRTGERGDKAERMSGGRTDMISAASQ